MAFWIPVIAGLATYEFLIAPRTGTPSITETAGLREENETIWESLGLGNLGLFIGVSILLAVLLYGTASATKNLPPTKTKTLLDDWAAYVPLMIVIFFGMWLTLNLSGYWGESTSTNGASKSTYMTPQYAIIGFFGLILLYFLVYRKNMFCVKTKFNRLIGGKNSKKRKTKKRK